MAPPKIHGYWRDGAPKSGFHLLGIEMIAEVVDAALGAAQLCGREFEGRRIQLAHVMLGLHPATSVIFDAMALGRFIV